MRKSVHLQSFFLIYLNDLTAREQCSAAPILLIPCALLIRVALSKMLHHGHGTEAGHFF